LWVIKANDVLESVLLSLDLTLGAVMAAIVHAEDAPTGKSLARQYFLQLYQQGRHIPLFVVAGDHYPSSF
jgi:hypothetical protein